MCKYLLPLIGLFFVLTQFSCDEVPPFIDIEEEIMEPDTSMIDTSDIVMDTIILLDTFYISGTIPTAQEKIVLIEDFSGVACVNCPKGNEMVEELINEYNGRVIGMTLHAGNFANPRPENADSFRIPETVNISTFLNVIAYPSAAIDRFKFEGEFALTITNRNTWPIRTAERIETTAPVNLEISTTFDASTNRLTALIKAVYTETIIEEIHNLSVFVLESGIIDRQDTNDPEVESGYILDYEHNHVVRDMMTPATGIQLNSEEIVPGLTIEKEFTMIIPEKWVPANMEVVATVQKTGISKEVLQAAEAHVE